MNKKIKVIVSFSGGKDSLASLIMAIKKYGKENIIVVFCDTGWEHPFTYEHIKEVITHFDLWDKFVTLSSGKYSGFEDMVEKKGRFPSSQSRFCTEELKVKPMIDWILDNYKYHGIIVQGIRADESTARSLMRAQCTYFKYYFEPYNRNDWKLEKMEISIAKFKAKNKKVPLNKITELEVLREKVARGVMDEKYYTYRKEDVIAHCAMYSDDVVRIVFDKTANEVIQIILDAGLKPNPLYYFDMGRVGCFPCIMVSQPEFWHIMNHFPWIIDKLRDFEQRCNTTFFSPDFVPKRYRTKRTFIKDGRKKKDGSKNMKGDVMLICTIDDAVRYLKDKHAQGEMFEEKVDADRRCMSVFSVCE